MDGGHCILMLRGVRPFYSRKYDITKNPNYPLTSDADPRNTFNIEKFLDRDLKLHLNDEYEVVSLEEQTKNKHIRLDLYRGIL